MWLEMCLEMWLPWWTCHNAVFILSTNVVGNTANGKRVELGRCRTQTAGQLQTSGAYVRDARCGKGRSAGATRESTKARNRRCGDVRAVVVVAAAERAQDGAAGAVSGGV